MLACLGLCSPLFASGNLHIEGVKFGMSALAVSAEFDYCDKQDEHGELLIKGCNDDAREPYMEVRLESESNEVIAVTLEQDYQPDFKWAELQRRFVELYGEPDEVFYKDTTGPSSSGFRQYLCYGGCGEKAKLRSDASGLRIMFLHSKSDDEEAEKNRLSMELIDKPKAASLDKKVRKSMRSK